MKRIPLTNGKFALVDDEDYSRISKRKWYAHCISSKNVKFYRAEGYSRNFGKISMAMEVMNADKGLWVDHINHNTLDNRKSNLRLCDAKTNAYNRKKQIGTSSKYKGVYFSRKDKVWRSGIKKDGKLMCLGSFKEERDAARSYDKKARELFGEFACLNF